MNIFDLKDELLGARNRIDLTILAIDNSRLDLIFTGIESTYAKLQELIDEWCIIGEKNETAV